MRAVHARASLYSATSTPKIDCFCRSIRRISVEGSEGCEVVKVGSSRCKIGKGTLFDQQHGEPTTGKCTPFARNPKQTGANRKKPQAFPRILFQVKCMRPSDRFAQNYGRTGWIPPEPFGSNLPFRAYTTDQWYLYDGQRVQLIPAPRRGAPALYRETSLYYSDGHFWAVNGDATSNRVGEGQNNPPLNSTSYHFTSPANTADPEKSSSDDDDDDGIPGAWQLLKFDHEHNGSYAYPEGENRYLNLQHATQPWIIQALPPAFLHPQQNLSIPQQGQVPQPNGGIIGDLPILIALLAFSVPESRVHEALLQSVRLRYQPHTRLGGRGSGCKCQPPAPTPHGFGF